MTRAAKQIVTYFVQGEITKAIKIGKTTALSARLRALQTACSEKLVCLAVHQGDHEAEYHVRFKDLRLRGEWFKPDQKLLGFLAKSKEQRARRQKRAEEQRVQKLEQTEEQRAHRRAQAEAESLAAANCVLRIWRLNAMLAQTTDTALVAA